MLISAFVFACILFVVYLLPAAVASARRHVNRHAILALNALLGWTLIGWVIALVWALTSSTEAK